MKTNSHMSLETTAASPSARSTGQALPAVSAIIAAVCDQFRCRQVTSDNSYWIVPEIKFGPNDPTLRP